MTQQSASAQLGEIRSRLRSDAWRRRRTHLVDGLLVCAATAVVAGFCYYLLDRRLGLYREARALLDLVWAVPIVWLAWLWLLPALRKREDEIDVALRYERRLGIDADLVAALQFEAAGREARGASSDTYGSCALRGALLEQVGDMGPRLAEAEEPPDPRIVRRKRMLSIFLLSSVIVVAVWPNHFTAFVRRAALADVPYPSNTKIDQWRIDGKTAEARTDGPALVTVAMGRPATFELQASGEIPDYAIVELMSESGAATSLELTPSESDRSVFHGTLPAVVESARGRFVAGDAFSETFEMQSSPLPLITVSLEVTPPDYAAGVDMPSPPPGRLSAAVLEGSSVAVVVECANKELRQAKLIIAGHETPLVPVDGSKKKWRADPAGTKPAAAEGANGGLGNIHRQIDFQIEVVDIHGFLPAEQLKGSIGLRPDMPPTVAAEIVTKWVLPSGKPSVAYEAGDDLGIQELAVTRQVLRLDGSTATDRVEIPLSEAGPATKLTGKFPLPLDGLQLAKGDKVTIRVEARDRRADAGRAGALSEPLTLEVTDEQGLYEAMAETDQRSARKMDEIIQKQLMMTGRGSTGVAPLKPVSPASTPSATATPTSLAPSPAPQPSGSPSPAAGSSPTIGSPSNNNLSNGNPSNGNPSVTPPSAATTPTGSASSSAGGSRGVRPTATPSSTSPSSSVSPASPLPSASPSGAKP